MTHMDIVYAAEKTSIAALLGEHLDREVCPAELRVSENPSETGSFYVGWEFGRYVVAPDGAITRDTLSL